MKNKEIKAAVSDLMASAVGKSEIYSKLVDQGAKKKMVAHYIASYPDERIGANHRGKVRVLVAIMLAQAILAFLQGYGMATQNHPQYVWLFGCLAAAISLLFAWGFYRPSAIAYNAYIILSFFQMPRQMEGFTEAPIVNAIVLAISLAILGFVWFVRSKLFPDFGFISPKRVKGDYVFAS